MYLSFQRLRPFSNWDNLQKETTEGLHIFECSNKVVVKSGDQTRAWSCKPHLPKCTPCVGVHLKLSLITRLIVVDPLTSNHFPQGEGSLEVEVTCRATDYLYWATWDVSHAQILPTRKGSGDICLILRASLTNYFLKSTLQKTQSVVQHGKSLAASGHSTFLACKLVIGSQLCIWQSMNF